MSLDERSERLLHAWFDGELSGLARWRFRRRLEREPALREELAELERLREHIRGAEEGIRSPHLWPALAPALAGADREAEARPGWRLVQRVTSWLGARLRELASPPGWLSLATAGAAVALVVGLSLPGAPPELPVAELPHADTGALRYLDTAGRPVWVLQDSETSTILWLAD